MYPSRATLVAASAVDELTAASTTEQDAYHVVAQRLVERFCAQTFTLEPDVTVAIDGNGGTRLPLPRRLAVLTGFGEDSTITADDAVLSADHDALLIGAASGLGMTTWAERALMDFEQAWPSGPGAVSVTGDWGWTDAEMPDDADSPIGVAMRLDMEDQALAATHGLVKTIRAAARFGIKSINEGPLGVDLDPPEVLLSPEAQAVLEPYIWQPVPVVA
jgi:hypothetical protein